MVLLEELEKAEAVAKALEEKVRILEEIARMRSAEFELKEKEWMKREEECKEDAKQVTSLKQEET